MEIKELKKLEELKNEVLNLEVELYEKQKELKKLEEAQEEKKYKERTDDEMYELHFEVLDLAKDEKEFIVEMMDESDKELVQKYDEEIVCLDEKYEEVFGTEEEDVVFERMQDTQFARSVVFSRYI